MAQPHVVFINCLYLAELYPTLRISDIAQLVEHWTDDLEIVGFIPLFATIFLPTMFTCGIRLYSWRPAIRTTEAYRVK